MSHGLKGATSEGSTVLHTSFCNLSSISKYQPGAPTQTLQQYFMQGRREVSRDKEQPQEKETS